MRSSRISGNSFNCFFRVVELLFFYLENVDERELFMKVLLVGNGGREHAIAKKIAESPTLTEFFSIPGNPGINTLAKVADTKNEPEAIADWAKNNGIDLIVCGPEIPLVAGLADFAAAKGIPVFGPKKIGAMLEGSKIFSKRFMEKYNIPTAPFVVLESYEAAVDYVKAHPQQYPMVIKADGLAAGKGVKIAKDENEALDTLKDYMVNGILGEAGKKIVIEQFMPGEEMSVFYITDGKKFMRLIAAKDYKKAFDGDKGENTGGMGCYAPHQSLTKDLSDKIEKLIMPGIKKGFDEEKFDYRGVLYVGLMLTADGPKVVEFNCRFGDPETQGIMPLIDEDVVKLFYQAATGTLEYENIKWKDMFAASVVVASKGYPGSYEKGKEISFETDMKDYIHAGTKEIDGKIVTNGGRVLNAVAVGATKAEALKKAYELAAKVKFDGCFYRKDIGS